MRSRALFLSVVMGSVVFLVCFPLIVLIAGSLMSGESLVSILQGAVGQGTDFAGIPLVPAPPTMESYVAVLADTPAYHVLFQNSTIIVVATLTGQFVVATPAAWSFARFSFFGKNVLFFVYVLLMMLPFQVVMLPNYLVLSALGINNTLLAIILPGIFNAFPVFIMRHFFSTIPESVIESARLDGAGEFRIFVTIGIPLGSAGIFASLVLGFFEYWNLVEQPLAFLKDQILWPISLFLPTITYENVGVIFASAVVAALPAVLVFLMGKDFLEQGIATTTRKDG